MTTTTANKAATPISCNPEKTDHDFIENVEMGLEKGSEVAPSHTRRKKTNPVEIRLVRKLDFIMLPCLWLMYFFNYLDRNAIAVARLDNLEQELGLEGTQYLTCVSILFVGYILGQLPSSKFPMKASGSQDIDKALVVDMILTRVRPSYYMAGFMALWAIVSTLTAIAKDFTGLLLTRFFLGVLEAPFYPGTSCPKYSDLLRFERTPAAVRRN